jgi:hypothetical protein
MGAMLESRGSISSRMAADGTTGTISKRDQIAPE